MGNFFRVFVPSVLALTACGSGGGLGSSSSQVLVDGVSASEKRIFITSTMHLGNLGGLVGADAICANRAFAAGLSRSYLAVLGTATSTVASRFTRGSSGIITFNASGGRVVVASSLTTFLSGTFLADPVLRFNELRQDQVSTDLGTSRFWLGASSGVGYSGADCNAWTTDLMGTNGDFGTTSNASFYYLNSATNRISCNSSRRLLCMSE